MDDGIVGTDSPNATNAQIENTTKVQSDCIKESSEHAMCSGFGQPHTNEPEKEKPNKKLTPYNSVTWSEILKKVDKPSTVAKSKAQWLIPSTLMSRTFKTQEEEGKYWMLWGDLDEDIKPIEEVEKVVKELGGFFQICNYEIYTTSSATEDNQKCRILIPLANLLDGESWKICQETLNAKLIKGGLTPDTSNEKPAQLCYLPNRGGRGKNKFYNKLSRRDGLRFDAETVFKEEIAAGKLANVVFKEKQDQEQAKREKKRANLKYKEGESLIHVFNAVYPVEEILLKAGYKQKRNTNSFRHPASSSSSTNNNEGYGAGVKDGRVNSLNENDPLNTGKGSHDAFSAFTVIFHGGDTNAALKDAGDNWLMVGKESWNVVGQREYAKNKTLSTLLNHSTMAGAEVGVGAEIAGAGDAIDGELVTPIPFIYCKPDKDGNPTTPLGVRENLEQLMRHYNIQSSYNLIKKGVSVSGIEILKGEEENLLIAELKSLAVHNHLTKCVVDEQLYAITLLNAFNPVTDLLKTLKRTKSHNPIEELIEALPLENKPWCVIAFTRWLIQACASADAGETTPNKEALPKFESVPVFYGEQGVKKTSFLRALLPESLRIYMGDGLSLDVTDKDSIMKVVRYWIVELGEIDSTFKKSEISGLKGFLSSREDIIRKAYAKAESEMPRRTTFAGTVNDELFLRDVTGNRRYLPIVVKGKLEIPAGFDINDLWAYAWGLYQSGEQWWFTEEEEVLQKRALDKHQYNPVEQKIHDYYDFDFDNGTHFINQTVSQIFLNIKLADSQSNKKLLSNFLKKEGIVNFKKDKKGAMYKMPRKTQTTNLVTLTSPAPTDLPNF